MLVKWHWHHAQTGRGHDIERRGERVLLDEHDVASVRKHVDDDINRRHRSSPNAHIPFAQRVVQRTNVVEQPFSQFTPRELRISLGEGGAGRVKSYTRAIGKLKRAHLEREG